MIVANLDGQMCIILLWCMLCVTYIYMHGIAPFTFSPATLANHKVFRALGDFSSLEVSVKYWKIHFIVIIFNACTTDDMLSVSGYLMSSVFKQRNMGSLLRVCVFLCEFHCISLFPQQHLVFFAALQFVRIHLYVCPYPVVLVCCFGRKGNFCMAHNRLQSGSIPKIHIHAQHRVFYKSLKKIA